MHSSQCAPPSSSISETHSVWGFEVSDLVLTDACTGPLATVSIDHYRVLKLLARGHGQLVKLPLRFKYDHQLLDDLMAVGLVERGQSGWPGVPAYRLTALGTTAQQTWLAGQSVAASVPSRPRR